MNCWEFKNCGRVPGGANALTLGVCPAYSRKAGEACWLVAGTFCGGKVQGTFAQKELSCMNCEFYKKFDMKHRMEMLKRFKAETSLK